jgi:hypothetical protein
MPASANSKNQKPLHGVAHRVLELENNHCRWPIGDINALNFRFCCEPVIKGLPYCPEHTKKAFNRSPSYLQRFYFR